MSRPKFSWAQEEDFVKAINPNALQDAIEWIQSNLDPDDVFAEDTLAKWADQNDYVKES